MIFFLNFLNNLKSIFLEIVFPPSDFEIRNRRKEIVQKKKKENTVIVIKKGMSFNPAAPKLFHLALTAQSCFCYQAKLILNFHDKFYIIVFLIYTKIFGY